MDGGADQFEHQFLMLDIGVVQEDANTHFLEEGEGDPSASLAWHIRVVNKFGGGSAATVSSPPLSQVKCPFQAVLGDQDLDGVLLDHQDVTFFVSGLILEEQVGV